MGGEKQRLTVSAGLEFELPTKPSKETLLLLGRLVQARQRLIAMRDLEFTCDEHHLADAVELIEGIANLLARARACDREE